MAGTVFHGSILTELLAVPRKEENVVSEVDAASYRITKIEARPIVPSYILAGKAPAIVTVVAPGLRLPTNRS